MVPFHDAEMDLIPMPSAKPAPAKPAVDLLGEEHHCAACRDALAAAAHELKTPLAIMGGYLHLLVTQKLGPLTPQQLEVLSEMQDNGVRLTSFVQNVLSYATLKVDRYEMQYEVADINACLREIAEFWVQRFQDKAIAFYFFPDEKLPAFPFDWYKVQHTVSNLLDNAMKYTPSLGHGVVACGAVFLGAPHHPAQAAGGAAAAAGGQSQLLPHLGGRHWPRYRARIPAGDF